MEAGVVTGFAEVIACGTVAGFCADCGDVAALCEAAGADPREADACGAAVCAHAETAGVVNSPASSAYPRLFVRRTIESWTATMR